MSARINHGQMDNQFVKYFSGLGISAGETASNYRERESVLNGFFTIHKNGTIKYCNKVAEGLVGGDSGGITGKNLWTDYGTVIPPDFYDIVHRAFHNERPGYLEEYPGTVGEWFDVIIYYCDDELSVSFKSIHKSPDVSDLQLELIRLNGLYRVVTEITSDCIWDWNLETKEIFWVDGGHMRVFGYQIQNALIPQSFWEDLIHVEDRKRVIDSLKQINVLDPSAIWEQEYRLRKADGIYAHVRDRGKVFQDKESEGIRMTGTTQDISVLKNLEMQLSVERLKKRKSVWKNGAEAQEAERKETANDIYHNMSQTLCAAKLYIECAKTDDERKSECLTISSEYVQGVIDELHGVYKKLRLAGMYNGLFESIRNLINQSNRMSRCVFELNINDIEEEDLEEVLQLDMYRIIQELVDNVVKHAAATRAWIDISRYRNEVTLMISDNGRGCNLLKTAMGLGLIQVLSCTDLYDSRVHTISEPEMGYTFKVVLPLSGRRKIPSQLLSDYDD